MKIWKLVSAAAALVLSTSANAALINNGTFTTDTDTGLDWMDVSITAGQFSVAGMLSELEAGGLYEGWAIASTAQVSGLFYAAGGSGSYTINDTQSHNSVSGLMNLLGAPAFDSLNFRQLFFITTEDDVYALSGMREGHYDPNVAFSGDEHSMYTYYNTLFVDGNVTSDGYALVRASVVPVPAAIWLFGSGLIGLVGFARRKNSF